MEKETLAENRIFDKSRETFPFSRKISVERVRGRVKLYESLGARFFLGFANRREESITGLVLPEETLVDALCYRPASFSKHFHDNPVDADALLSLPFVYSCFS